MRFPGRHVSPPSVFAASDEPSVWRLQRKGDRDRSHVGHFSSETLQLSVAEVPANLRMLDSQTVRNVLGDDSVVGNPLSILPPLSSTGSGESQASEAAGGSAEGGAPQEKKKKRKGKGLKLAMRRMASFNLKQTKKARGEGEEEEVFGPHIAPRIAHSLLHDKPAHVPAMYAAEGMDTGVRRPQAALMLRC